RIRRTDLCVHLRLETRRRSPGRRAERPAGAAAAPKTRGATASAKAITELLRRTVELQMDRPREPAWACPKRRHGYRDAASRRQDARCCDRRKLRRRGIQR